MTINLEKIINSGRRLSLSFQIEKVRNSSNRQYLLENRQTANISSILSDGESL